MADIQFKKLNVHRQHYKKELVHDDSLIHGINYVEQMTGLNQRNRWKHGLIIIQRIYMRVDLFQLLIF